MCLRWLGWGSHHDVRSNSGVSVAAFYASIHQIVDGIIAHPELQFEFPTSEPAQRHAAKAFERLSNSCTIKGCVGAVDGWLCPIRVPQKKRGFQGAIVLLWPLSAVRCKRSSLLLSSKSVYRRNVLKSWWNW
ncbi:hypothetical protein PPTG_22677 [Phytophthora nicotianae INRA-310]|uniref:DDE Tnp4 domain-containing protein n=1 Tax=Phytophthora nicotianae (strain INRA-310) TaxID=761204 RepID=W2QEI0_PHYN3|nr:hypothetical protein PPTG_22677 [Phytophthora nicotianae INRA-310]ETN10680.1 hypothetical protein PPTG_22677 [Phytophthora nicotianae INRA-310]